MAASIRKSNNAEKHLASPFKLCTSCSNIRRSCTGERSQRLKHRTAKARTSEDCTDECSSVSSLLGSPPGLVGRVAARTAFRDALRNSRAPRMSCGLFQSVTIT